MKNYSFFLSFIVPLINYKSKLLKYVKYHDSLKNLKVCVFVQTFWLREPTTAYQAVNTKSNVHSTLKQQTFT